LQRLPFAIVLAAIFAALGTTIASARPNISLKLQAALVQHDDKGVEKLVPVTSETGLKPGDVVRYAIVANNSGPDAATRLVPQGKVPVGTAYDAGSASASNSFRIEFSLDGGKTWSVKPTVKVRTAAGTTVEKSADPSLFTTLRWIDDKPLLPKTSESYSYEVRIK
jgi:uncharacterized repeat protein (TIGR01451 family)